MSPAPTAFAWRTHEEFKLLAERGSIFVGQVAQQKPTLQ